MFSDFSYTTIISRYNSFIIIVLFPGNTNLIAAFFLIYAIFPKDAKYLFEELLQEFIMIHQEEFLQRKGMAVRVLPY